VVLPTVLLELLHASAMESSRVDAGVVRRFRRRKTSLSPQCHAVNTKSMPSRTRLYVCKNFRLNRIASTSILNRGSLPGSSGSTSLPPPAVIRTPSLSSQGPWVDAVAWSANRKTSRSQGVSSMVVVVWTRTAGGMVQVPTCQCRCQGGHAAGLPRARVIERAVSAAWI
jgi:hypothetical protein